MEMRQDPQPGVPAYMDDSRWVLEMAYLPNFMDMRGGMLYVAAPTTSLNGSLVLWNARRFQEYPLPASLCHSPSASCHQETAL